MRLPFFVDDELRGREKNTPTLASIYNGPAVRGYNFSNEAKVKPKRAGDQYPANALHLFKSISLSVVLPLRKCLYQDVSVLRVREFVNNDFHAEISSELSACTKGGGVDGFGTTSLSKPGDAGDHEHPIRSKISATNFRIFKLEGMHFSPVALRLWPLLRRSQTLEDRRGIPTVATLTELTVASTKVKLRLQCKVKEV